MAEGILGDVRMTHPQFQFLRFVATRAGEIPWRWDRVERDDVRAMIRDLIAKGLLTERTGPTGGHAIALSDKSRALLERFEQRSTILLPSS